MKDIIDLAEKSGATVSHKGILFSNRNQLKYFSEHIRQSVIPLGFVLLPLEPSDEMLVAGQEAWVNARNQHKTIEYCSEAANVYRSMKDAALKEGNDSGQN